MGSEFFNVLAGKLGAGFMKTMAKLPGCDRKTRDAFAAMGVAGYNYGIKRYKGDLKKYPDRVILGSETFCADAYAFWELAKKNNALIGDFVWAGIDYLGEVGIGTREYRDYAPDYLHGLGWVSAGSGRLDLTGRELGEALYTKVAFELTDKPAIAVIPVNHTHDSPSPSCWKFTNAFPSWSWNGCDGNDAKVEVYSRAPVVKLLVNGKQVGQKKLGKNCRFEFRTKYYGGEVTAVACDADGNELSVPRSARRATKRCSPSVPRSARCPRASWRSCVWTSRTTRARSNPSSVRTSKWKWRTASWSPWATPARTTPRLRVRRHGHLLRFRACSRARGREGQHRRQGDRR